MTQRLEYFINPQYEEQDQCGTEDVCDDDKISKELDDKGEESVDTPVSFIEGYYERLQANVTAMSAKIMNNEVTYKSVPKQTVFQNQNNLQNTQERWTMKSMFQDKFHRNSGSCFAGFEVTDQRKELPQPFSGSCGLKDKKSSFGGGFESGNNSLSAAKIPGLEIQKPNSVVVEHEEDKDTEEEQCEEGDSKACGALMQESENLHLTTREENLRAAVHSRTKEQSPEQGDKEEKQQKKETNGELQTAVVQGVKNSIHNDSHQVHNASKDNPDGLPPEAAEEEEASESPWDSEADCGSLRKVASGVFVPATGIDGKYAEIIAGGCNNDEYSGSSSHVSSPEKEDIKDTIENYGVQVEKEKSKQKCFPRQEVPKQEDLDQLNPPPANVTEQQVKQNLTVRNNEDLKTENGNTMEEKDKKCLSSEERSTLIKMPMKGKFALNTKVAKKNTRQASKQKANQHMNLSSGNPFSVLDDSSSTETSQDEGRPAAKARRKKKKASMQMDGSDGLGSTHSSDTASEDVKLTTPNNKKAALLLEQLSVHLLGSALSQIQDLILEYEETIKCEKKRYRSVCRELRKLESEKESLQLIAKETQHLAQLEMKWKNDIQSLKLALEEEEAKRLTAETLCERAREALRRKEDQCCKELEEKQQLELHSRNLEMELITLKKLLTEAEEEPDETQRQLSQEKSARALQEGILNNHLWRQKELEEETRRTIRKNSKGMVRQLQQELADALKKQSMSEASLEVATRYRSDLEEDKLHLQKELEKVKTKLQELEEQYLQSECCVHGLKTELDDKERERVASSQKLQDLLLASSGTNTTIQQLEKQVHRLEIENAQLEATVQQQSSRTEALQRELQVSASVHKRLEDLIAGFQPTQAAIEEQQQQQMQKQNVMSLTLRESVWEEQLRSIAHFEKHIAQLDREKADLLEQVGELSQQLEIKYSKCVQLEAQNQDLQEELSTVRGNHEKLERSKCQLQEEVADLKHRLETSMSQMEQHKRAADEPADREIRHKIQEVNLFLQTQAAFQDQTEQLRATHQASLRNQLEQQIQYLERELGRIKQESIFQKESMQAEIEKYKELYLEEVKIRGHLANKLERANEKLAEASAKLLQEHHRSESLITSSFATGDLGPVLHSTELGHLGNNLALNGSLSLGTSFLSPARITLSSRKSVEAFVAKVRQEIDGKVTEELQRATAELEAGSARASPIVSADGCPRNVCVEQDPLTKAIQEYRDALTKTYMIR